MILNVILAVAPIPCALGAVAELQAGVGQLRAAADGTAEAGLALLVGDLVDPALVHRPLPALPGGPVAEEVRQDGGVILTEAEVRSGRAVRVRITGRVRVGPVEILEII